MQVHHKRHKPIPVLFTQLTLLGAIRLFTQLTLLRSLSQLGVIGLCLLPDDSIYLWEIPLLDKGLMILLLDTISSLVEWVFSLMISD